MSVARPYIGELKARTGERLSLTGFLAFYLACAVDEDRSVQVYLKGRKQLSLFDVDVGWMIKRKIGEERALMGQVIRGANHKTCPEIYQTF